MHLILSIHCKKNYKCTNIYIDPISIQNFIDMLQLYNTLKQMQQMHEGNILFCYQKHRTIQVIASSLSSKKITTYSLTKSKMLSQILKY